MPTDDARGRDTERATAFAEAGTTAVPEPEGGAEEPSKTPGTGPEDDVYEDVTEQEAEEPDPESPGDGEDHTGAEVPQSPPLTEFDPATETDPISEIDDESEQDADDDGALDAFDASQDTYRSVLAGAAEDILTGTSPFEGWRFVAGRAADAAADHVAVLEEALAADGTYDAEAAGSTADEAAALLGAGAYDPTDFTPIDIGLARGSVFGRVIYALQQEFSAGGGMETLLEGSEDAEAVVETLTTKLTNYVNWANGGHGDPVDAASIADLYRVAKEDAGLEKVAEAAWNRGTLRGEVRSQAYVDKSESMEKIAAFTVQEVETGLAELDAHVAITDYSDSWIMSDGEDIETYVDAAADAVKDGFKTVMAAARLWNQQEQELSEDAEKQAQYADAAAFFPDSDHAQQNRGALYTLAEEGVAMMAAGRDALDSGLIDTIEAELSEWERVFEEQEVGALLDLTDEDYTALEEAHDAYTEAKTAIADVAGTLESVLSYTAGEHDGAVDAIDAATASLADLGADVVDEMAPDQAGGYGNTAVGEAMKDIYLPSYTPQADDARRDDLNTALRTFAGYVS